MGVLQGVRAYLSGAIEQAVEDGEDWRIGPRRVLRNEFGINLFDPFEDPKQQWAEPLRQAREDCDYEVMKEIATRFVQKDLTMVSRSDMLVAHLPYGVPTTGTHHEIVKGIEDKKPVLFVCPQGKQYNPLWYFGCGVPLDHFFGSWDALYSFLRRVEEGQLRHDRRWHYIYKMI
jgi:hypothetical protein